MNKNKQIIDKCLARYSEPFLHVVKDIQQKWARLVLIPCFGEGKRIEQVLNSVEHSASENHVKTLLIFCINESIDAQQNAREKNLESILYLNSLNQTKTTLSHQPKAFLSTVSENLDCAWIELVGSDQLPTKQGVGLARKILGDIGLQLYANGLISSDYAWATDADVLVATDYLQELPKNKNISAYTVPFVHDTSDCKTSEERLACERYDFSLRYYVEGLRRAESHYAFDSIGSTIVYHQEAYAQVRGFPKLLAAEDFYFLNKVAKVGEIQKLNRRPIVLSGRTSDRVPFGTGASVIKLSADLSEGRETTLYHPMVFEVLKRWNQFWKTCILENSFPQLDRINEKVFFDCVTDKTNLWVIGFLKGQEKAFLQAKRLETRENWFQDAFDGFQTLKFVHLVRDTSYPNVIWSDRFFQEQLNK